MALNNEMQKDKGSESPFSNMNRTKQQEGYWNRGLQNTNVTNEPPMKTVPPNAKTVTNPRRSSKRVMTPAFMLITGFMSCVFLALLVLVSMQGAGIWASPSQWGGYLPLWQDDQRVDTNWYTQHIGTRGTSANPFLISNAQELAGLAHLVNRDDNPIQFTGQFIRMTGDINLNGAVWVPIGTGQTPDNRFRGSFSGAGFNITMPEMGVWSWTRYFGLFGRVDAGEIRLVNLHGNINTWHNLRSDSRVGSIAGSVHVATRLFGIVNYVNLNLTSAQDVDAVGGIVGYSTNHLEAYNIANFGHINTNFARVVGGVFGRVNRGIIANVFNQGNVITQGVRPGSFAIVTAGVGGIIGSRGTTVNDPGLVIWNVYNIGNVSAQGSEILGRQTSTSTNNSPKYTVNNFGMTLDMFGRVSNANGTFVRPTAPAGEMHDRRAYHGMLDSVSGRISWQTSQLTGYYELLDQLNRGNTIAWNRFQHMLRTWEPVGGSLWPQWERFPRGQDPGLGPWPPEVPCYPGCDCDPYIPNGNGYRPTQPPVRGRYGFQVLLVILLILSGLSIIGFVTFSVLSKRDELQGT